MIKVLIVDDEVMFRIGVKSCINWNKYGYELVGEASDGKQALEIIEKFKPDVVFTDIKMPVMDGLELTRRVVKDFPDTRLIILSCYNDFEYVKEALRLGARDYILKLSLKPEDLEDLLVKMKETIYEENNVKQYESAIKQEFNINLNKLKEEFLKRIIFEDNDLHQDKFVKKAKVLGLKFHYDNNRMILIKIDDYLNVLNAIKDETLLEFAFINIANEIISKYFPGEVIKLNRGLFVCIISEKYNNEEENRSVVSRVIRDINSSTKKYLNYSISAGASKSSGDIQKFQLLFKETIVALDRGFYRGREFFDFYKERNIDDNAEFIIDLETESRLVNALETDNIAEVMRLLEHIYAGFHENLSPSFVKAIFKEIIYIFNRVVKRYDKNLFGSITEDPIKKIDDADTLESIKVWMEGFVQHNMKHITELKSKLLRGEIIKVIDYIKSNIDSSISLKDAAKIANMSEKYFCVIFKKETGKNFVDYINELKVDRAKELLKNREIKTYEVAQRVGFMNEGYFSKIFKKYSGSTPQEYRKSCFTQ